MKDKKPDGIYDLDRLLKKLNLQFVLFINNLSYNCNMKGETIWIK